MTRTNLITGFLGSGKTSSILHLLAHKDPNEKWAVLVNEFGEVGIDGALLADSGALLKENPGGYMCCVNGLPMQVGLNTLLRQGKPDRLLIEPTGLGHPKQILDLLTAPVYEPWIDHPRHLVHSSDPRACCWTKKAPAMKTSVTSWLPQTSLSPINPTSRRPKVSKRYSVGGSEMVAIRQLIHSEHGKVDGHLLDLPRRNLAELPASAAHSHQHVVKKGLAALSLPEHQRWRRSRSSRQRISILRAGYSTLIRYSTPLAFWNGRDLHRWNASKACCVFPKGWCESTVRAMTCTLKRKTLRHRTAVLS